MLTPSDANRVRSDADVMLMQIWIESNRRRTAADALRDPAIRRGRLGFGPAGPQSDGAEPCPARPAPGEQPAAARDRTGCQRGSWHPVLAKGQQVAAAASSPPAPSVADSDIPDTVGDPPQSRASLGPPSSCVSTVAGSGPARRRRGHAGRRRGGAATTARAAAPHPSPPAAQLQVVRVTAAGPGSPDLQVQVEHGRESGSRSGGRPGRPAGSKRSPRHASRCRRVSPRVRVGLPALPRRGGGRRAWESMSLDGGARRVTRMLSAGTRAPRGGRPPVGAGAFRGHFWVADPLRPAIIGSRRQGFRVLRSGRPSRSALTRSAAAGWLPNRRQQAIPSPVSTRTAAARCIRVLPRRLPGSRLQVAQTP